MTGGPAPWRIHCDGTALPNRGRTSVGAVLIAPDGARHTVSRATGQRGHSNEAEASALIAALETARSLGARAVHVSCDSVVVITQTTTGGERTSIEPLATLCAEARRLLAGFDEAEVEWVPRHRNGEADALARAGLGLAPKPPTQAQRRRLEKPGAGAGAGAARASRAGVMYMYIMHRTQIYLSEEQSATLARIAARDGRSVSHLIRDAVDRTYAAGTGSDVVLDVLARTKGAWRGDRPTGSAQVERMRSGARLRRGGK